GMMVEKNKDFSPELVQPYLTREAAAFTTQLHEDFNDSLVIAMHGAAGLSVNPGGPFTAIPLAMTAAKSTWNKKIKPDENMVELAEDEETPHTMGMGGITITIGDGSGSGDKQKKADTKQTDPGMLQYDSSKGDQRGPLPAVIGLTRTINGREQ